MEIEQVLGFMRNKRVDYSRDRLPLSIKSNADRTRREIFNQEDKKREGICGIVAYFKRTKPLTIFEVELLYKLFAKNTKPRDYDQYHKCLAGKEFFENIERITLLKSEVNIKEIECSAPSSAQKLK